MAADTPGDEPHRPGRSNQYVVETTPIDQLRRNPLELRQHSKRKIKRLAGAIDLYGQLPILVDENGVILNGHAVLDACKLLGRSTVEVIRITPLSEPLKLELMALVNTLAEEAKWDLFPTCQSGGRSDGR